MKRTSSESFQDDGRPRRRRRPIKSMREAPKSVELTNGSVTLDDIIIVVSQFQSDSEEPRVITKGTQLMVQEIDIDGDICVNTVDYEWSDNEWIYKANFPHLARKLAKKKKKSSSRKKSSRRAEDSERKDEETPDPVPPLEPTEDPFKDMPPLEPDPDFFPPTPEEEEFNRKLHALRQELLTAEADLNLRQSSVQQRALKVRQCERQIELKKQELEKERRRLDHDRTNATAAKIIVDTKRESLEQLLKNKDPSFRITPGIEML